MNLYFLLSLIQSHYKILNAPQRNSWQSFFTFWSFLLQNFCLNFFCIFLIKHSLSSQVTFLRFRLSLVLFELSLLFSLRSKHVAITKFDFSIAKKTESLDGSASGWESGGPWFETQRMQLFLR